VGPRTDLDIWRRENVVASARIRTLDRPAPSVVTVQALCELNRSSGDTVRHRVGPGSIPEQSVWYLCCTKWHCDMFLPQYLCFPQSVSFHLYSILFHLSITDAAVHNLSLATLSILKKHTKIKNASNNRTPVQSAITLTAVFMVFSSLSR
jgi:hypothetical protein